MTIQQLYAVDGLAIGAIRLAAHMIRYACFGHEVALIATVHKYFGRYRYIFAFLALTRKQGYAFDGTMRCLCAYQTMPHQCLYSGMCQVGLKDGFGYFGFKDPLFKTTVMLAHFTVKIQSQTCHHIFIPDICLRQSAGTKSA